MLESKKKLVKKENIYYLVLCSIYYENFDISLKIRVI